MIQGTLPFADELACTTTASYDSMLGVSTIADSIRTTSTR
jgi:hypothetical protein